LYNVYILNNDKQNFSNASPDIYYIVGNDDESVYL